MEQYDSWYTAAPHSLLLHSVQWTGRWEPHYWNRVYHGT